jgi:hypothetical protein
MTFEDLEFKELSHDRGIQARVQFKNGYGASVVKGEYTYGGRDGFYELAVLNEDGRITYDTDITNDVCGFLCEAEVTALLMKIESL